MIAGVGRATVLVEDVDEALSFYADAFGFESIWEGEVDGGVRIVHAGVPGQPPVDAPGNPRVGLWFVEATGENADRVGDQTGDHPAFVFYADDCRETAAHLRERGVTVHGEPSVDDSGSAFVHVEDLYGNGVVVVELDAA